MAKPITGILTPNITPVDDAGRVDEERLRGYVDWLIDRGVDGLYPNGSTGEFVRFSAEERRRIVHIVVEQAGGRVPVLAGAAEANVKADAYVKFAEITNSKQAIVGFIKSLGRTIPATATADWLKNEVLNVLEKDPNYFLEIVSEPFILSLTSSENVRLVSS